MNAGQLLTIGILVFLVLGAGLLSQNLYQSHTEHNLRITEGYVQQEYCSSYYRKKWVKP